MKPSLIKLVETRAFHACEYCLLPMEGMEETFQVDHIIAESHDGPSVESNLAWSCPSCNRYKGTNVAGYDPDRTSNDPIRLFNPRNDNWNEHFRLENELIIGTSAIGRVTVRILRMNASHCRNIRLDLIEEGLYPPPHYQP